MINPDFHMTIHISEEVIRLVCLTIGFASATWGIVKMTQILFGKQPITKSNHEQSN